MTLHHLFLEWTPNRLFDYTMDPLGGGKFDFAFGWVNIHIHLHRINFKEKRKHGVPPFREKRGIGFIDRMRNCGILHGSVVDKNVLGGSAGSSMIGINRHTLHTKPRLVAKDLEHPIHKTGAIELKDPVGFCHHGWVIQDWMIIVS